MLVINEIFLAYGKIVDEYWHIQLCLRLINLKDLAHNSFACHFYKKEKWTFKK